MFGGGITRKIVDCYLAVVSSWRPGDSIYVFGFSRGAYSTAPSIRRWASAGVGHNRANSRCSDRPGTAAAYRSHSESYLHDGGFWKLGLRDDDTDLINPSGSYKGRVTILYAEQREQHVYFVLIPCGRDVPTVLGQHMFDHILEWEGARTRTGAVEPLFN